MLNTAHILETAFLLLAAFLAGAVVGSLARLAASRLAPAKAPEAVGKTALPEAQPTVAPEPALVASPVIEPVARPAQPAPPAEVPVPDFAAVVQAVAASDVGAVAPLAAVKMPRLEPLPPLMTTRPETVMAPARVAGQTTSGLLVPSPRVIEQAKAQVDHDAPSAEVIPFPLDRGSGAAEASDEITPVPEPVPAEPAPEPQAASASEAVAASAPPEPVVLPMPAPSEAAPAEAAAVATGEPPAQQDETSSQAADDEAAAMRAIEGGWSPRRGAGRRSAKAPKPEGIADEEPVPGERHDVLDEPPGRPVGMDGPRDGTKDNLTNIIGVLPIIETALNNAGVYHFDQIAALTDENVAWLEGHLGIAGRIDREHWREQARELAIVSERARKVAGQQ